MCGRLTRLPPYVGGETNQREAKSMSYDKFTTFKTKTEDGVLWVTFDYPTVNLQGQ